MRKRSRGAEQRRRADHVPRGRGRRWPLLGGIGAVAVGALAIVLMTGGAEGNVEPAPVAAADAAPPAAAPANVATQPQRAEPAARDAEPIAASEPTGEGGGPSEGIKVRGSWTIDVLDPDGTLVRRVEIENALRPEAANWLANALHSGVTWGVIATHYYALFIGDFGTFSGGLPPEPVLGEPPCAFPRVPEVLEGLLSPNALLVEGCYIIEGAAAALTGLDVWSGVSGDLERGVGLDESDRAFFVAAGSVEAERDGQVDYVESFVWQFAEPDPQPFRVIEFTARGIEPVQVVAGQTILITFEVRFQ